MQTSPKRGGEDTGGPSPFGALLRRHREAAALTREELAERSGLSARAIEDIERGRRRSPYPRTARVLADALGLGQEEQAQFYAARVGNTEENQTLVSTAGQWVPILPTPVTTLIGRDRELAAVVDLLAQGGARLVTLTGPGGVGKTRLALQAAEELAAGFADGVAFVDLAPLADPSLVPPAIAHALGVREAGDRPVEERLAGALRDRHLLLVLDNFEHLLEAAPLLADLLAACPRLAILVTSRVVLRLSGEHAVAVGPLAVPEAGRVSGAEGVATTAAVRLFAARAAAARADFALTDENAAAVAEVCRRLEGLPLAVELAAARVAHLPPAALLARLDRRLPLLTGGARDLPARQRTMRDAIAWSYGLLPAEEQALFRRMAVFVGGCTLEAAEVVAGALEPQDRDVLDGLAALVAKSLVVHEVGPGEDPRYRMLETVREFALERLASSGEEDAARAALAAHGLAVVEQLRPRIEGPEGAAVLQRLENDHANLRVALGWAIERGEAAAALRLAGALWKFWWVRRHLTDGRVWLERALALAGPAPTPARLEALYGAGSLALGHADHQTAELHGAAGLDLARRTGERLHEARFFFLLGNAAVARGDLDVAAGNFGGALQGFRAADAGDPAGAAFAQHGSAMALLGLATVASARREPDHAARLAEEALAIWRRRGDAWGTAQALASLGAAAAADGDIGRSCALYRESLALHATSGDDAGVAEGLAGLGRAAALGGEVERAARLLAAAEELRTAAGVPLAQVSAADQERAVAAAKQALGEAAFARASAAGRQLRREEAVAEALTRPDPPRPLEKPSTQPCGVDALTGRESEVLRLVVDGRTDREIAAELLVSHRTVTSHVSAILGKLGVDTRTAAATLAMRRGLV